VAVTVYRHRSNIERLRKGLSSALVKGSSALRGAVPLAMPGQEVKPSPGIILSPFVSALGMLLYFLPCRNIVYCPTSCR